VQQRRRLEEVMKELEQSTRTGTTAEEATTERCIDSPAPLSPSSS
jgi:hypothetical protein